MGRQRLPVKKKDHPEYDIWCGIKGRCRNRGHKRYPLYGGRGIDICDEWAASFDAFLAHIGPRPSPKHSVERKDNNRGYEPGNVRWATQLEQSRNRRDNVYIEHDGQRLTLKEWGERLGLWPQTIARRIAAGWSITDALFRAPAPGPGDKCKNEAWPQWRRGLCDG